jgi:hypothetical protein
MLRIFTFFLFCLTISQFSKAQNSFPRDQELLDRFAAFNRNNPKDLLFVHTDKQIYTNGEQLWFSAYLVESLSAKPEEHNILSVTLVREDNRKLHFQEKYAMENGLAFGSFFLHDTLPPGNYQVLFSTNILDKNYRPIAQFSQEIIVKSITQVSFNARLSMLDSLPVNGEIRVDVGVEFTNEDGYLHIQPEISYNVGSGKIRTKKLSKKNKGILSIPAEELNQPNLVLLVSITCKNEVQHLNLKLPEIKLPGLSVGFFPEGGYLIEGLSNLLGWETRTTANLPVALTGILYRNDQPVDTVSTNSYGIGSFRIVPEQGSNYSLRIEKNSHITSDTSFHLPAALREGIVLQLEEGVVNDTLAISLSSVINQKVKIFIHDYRDGYSSFYQQVQPLAKRVLIALPAVPKGLATITVLDEQGRPLAERLFFAHFNQRAKLLVNTSKDVAKKREEVTFKLKLTDERGNPLSGIVSVACIQEGRLDDFRQRDIESYSLLEAKMQQLPANPLERRIEDKAYLENILLVRGWRRYTWQQMVGTQVTRDTLTQTQTLDIKGKVLFNDRDLKKAVSVNIMRDGQFDFLQTEPNGDFNFQREHLITKVGRKVFAVVGTKNTEAYSVRMIWAARKGADYAGF